jgi:prenyltransferase beta subunit
MRNRTIISAVVLALVVCGALPALGLAAADTDAALEYLKTQQNADGGFGSGFSPDSGVGSTADAVLAILSIGGDLSAFDQEGNTPLTYLSANATSVSTAGDLSKLILAVVAADENPREFGGIDLVARLEGMVGAEGRIGGEADTFVAHILAVLALSSVQRAIPAPAVDLIQAAQQDNGSWAWDGSAETAGDTNTTACAVQALAAAGEAADSAAITKALAYYRDIQNDDGGWPYQNPSDFGTATDANSTAVTIQAIVAAGQDPAGAAWAAATGATPVSALESFQNESGAFAWQATVPDDNLLATVQALPALAGKAFPFATVDVGEATVSAPATVPETGGTAFNLAPPLLLAGLALLGGSYALRRKR